MVLLWYYLFPEPETEQKRIIRHADTLILNSDYLGKIDKRCLAPFGLFHNEDLPLPLLALRNEITAALPIINGDLEPYKNGMTKNFDDLRDFLLSNEYIDKPDAATQEWILNIEGKLMKRIGGHLKYQRYKDNKLAAEIEGYNATLKWWQRDVIKWLIAFILGVIATLITQGVTRLFPPHK